MRSAEISRFFRAGRPTFLTSSDRAPSDRDELDEIERLTDAWRSLPKRNARINGHIRRHLSKAGITGGKVLEIGRVTIPGRPCSLPHAGRTRCSTSTTSVWRRPSWTS